MSLPLTLRCCLLAVLVGLGLILGLGHAASTWRFEKCNSCMPLQEPVCATNHKTYDNHCLAFCDGASVSCSGKCPCKRFSACDCCQPSLDSPQVCSAVDIDCDKECLFKDNTT